MLCCDWLVFNSCDWCISILAVSVICSLCGPLLYGSPAVVFLDRGHPCFWNFYSTVPVVVVRVKSYANHLFDPVCVTMRITINKFYTSTFPSLEYVRTLFDELVQLRRQFPSYRAAEREFKPMLQALPKPLTSQHPRQEKEEVVTQHKSRFNK